MPENARHNLISLEEAAPYRTLSQFVPGPSTPDSMARTPRRTLLGLPARSPLFSPGDSIAKRSHDQLDAA
jgi:hypothetical protein